VITPGAVILMTYSVFWGLMMADTFTAKSIDGEEVLFSTIFMGALFSFGWLFVFILE